MDELRLDSLLVKKGLVTGRDRAKELIDQGLILVNGSPASKPSQKCKEEDALAVLGDSAHFVSRAAHKLEKALDIWKINLEGKTVLDVGASTGGFTQLALERGAKHVYAVDVGSDQLKENLRKDSRVSDLQKTDIRMLSADALPEIPDFAVCDVSFISLRLVLPKIRQLLEPSGQAVILIKPQFEAGRQAVGRGGLVKDPKVHERVLREILELLKLNRFTVAGLTDSPIRGGDGNIEFLAWLCPGEEQNFDLPALVRKAHQTSEKKDVRA